MKKVGILAILTALFVVVSLTGPTLASNVHLKKPGLSFTDNGLTLTASGALAGLGNEDVNVTITAKAIPTATCTNPGGSSKVPGQNPASVSVTGSTSIPASQIKNGNVDFTVTTNPPTSPVVGAPACPNPSWTEEITDMAFTSAVITVEQPPGPANVVLTISKTFRPPTTDGPVP